MVALLLCCVASIAACAASKVRFGVVGLFHPEEIELRTAGTEVLMVSGGPQPPVLNGGPGHRFLLLRAAGDRVVLPGSVATELYVSGRGGGAGRLQLRVPGSEHPTHWTRKIEPEAAAVPKADDESSPIRFARKWG